MANAIPTRKWTTQDEIDFLRRIGTHRTGKNVLPRRELLRKYRRSIAQRSYWGAVDRQLIENYLTLEIGKDGAT
jgi:hypothetical protein